MCSSKNLPGASSLLCAVAVSLGQLATSAQATAAPSEMVIRNVTVIDVEAGEAIPRRDVVVRGQEIAAIVPAGEASAEGDVGVIDGSGLYLMPGLFDAHVHMSAGAEVFPPLLIAHGVTAARDTGADTNIIMRLREQAARNGLMPDLVVTGAIVDGRPPIWPFSEACDTPEEAREAVQRLAAAGVDQIKVYSMLKAEVYHAAVEEAKRHELTVTGHVPLTVTLFDAIQAGQDCVEHFDGMAPILLDLAGGERPQRGGPFAAMVGWTMYDDVPAEKLREVLDQLADAGMMQCPTIVVMKSIARSGDEAVKDDPRMKYIPPSVRAFWEGPGYAQMADFASTMVPAMQQLAGAMYEAGVPMMIGTDLANPYVFPGWSVHEEMQLFQDAGIPAAEVLRMATIVPARFCGVDDRLGSITEGRVASLVLVARNPLEDIAHATTIEGVFLRGRYFDGEALDGLKEKAARIASEPGPEPGEVDLRLPGEVVYRGRYVVKFDQWDAGVEHFLITRSPAGWHLVSHMLAVGGQPPTVTTIHLDPEYGFDRAIWEQHADPPLVATYTIEDGRMVARAQRGDGDVQTESIDLPEPSFISFPSVASDILILPALGLEPGESFKTTAVSFGYPGWQLQHTPIVVMREPDGELAVNEDETIPAQIYKVEFETPMGEFAATVWLDAAGLLRRAETDMPFGTLRIEYDPNGV